MINKNFILLHHVFCFLILLLPVWGIAQVEVPVLPENEINYVIEKGIENGLSDFQITDELRKRGLGDSELSALNAKILTKRREKLNLKEEEFLNAFNLIQKKYGRRIEKPEETFTINIGEVDIIFNMSNV